MRRSLLGLLPQGGTLPEQSWVLRHRGVVVLLWLHSAVIPIVALTMGYSVLHSAAEGLIVPAAAAIASMGGLARRVRTMAAAVGLLSSSAVLVHLSGGLIEMHFHFFVMVVVVSLYQDWLPFLAAVGYVFVHHGILGALDPGSVFNHPAAISHPWRWAAIHAVFISGISLASLVNWRLNESYLTQRRRAEARLREESRIVERLNEVGRMLAADLELDHVVQRVTDVATELTSAQFGAFFYNVSDPSGDSYLLYSLSGVPAEAFAGLPMPRATGVFGPTFAGEGVVRLDDVTTHRHGLFFGHGDLDGRRRPLEPAGGGRRRRGAGQTRELERAYPDAGDPDAEPQPILFGEAQRRERPALDCLVSANGQGRQRALGRGVPQPRQRPERQHQEPPIPCNRHQLFPIPAEFRCYG